MKNKTFIALFTALMTVALLVSGCAFNTGAVAAPGEGILKLIVKGADVSGRTIMPALTYKATITPATGAPIVKTLNAGVNVLALGVGEYSLLVEAFNGDVLYSTNGTDTDPDGEAIELTADGALTVTVVLTPVTATGKGTFAWDLSLLDTAKGALIAVFKLDEVDFDTFDIAASAALDDAEAVVGIGDAEDLLDAYDIEAEDAEDGDFIGDIELDAGEYAVYFLLDDGEEGAVWTEVLIIYSGLTTTYQPSFEDVLIGKGAELLQLILDSLEEQVVDFAAPELAALGIDGVDAGNVADVRTAVEGLLDADNFPTNLSELKNLIDAALVAGGAIGVDPEDTPAKRDIANAEIEALIKNGTTFDPDEDIDWDDWEAPDYKVTITVGAYTVVVSILPIEEPEFIEVLELAQSYAVYKFTLPGGTTYGDYKAIKASYKMDAINLAKATRSVRLHGDYSKALSNFAENDGNGYPTWNFDGSNAAYIYDDLGTGAVGSAVADEWFTLTYKLVGNSPNQPAHTTDPDRHPVDSATGTFYFGIGIPGGTSSDTTSTVKTQQVKNITMVHKSDPKKNVVLHEYSFYGFIGKADVPDEFVHIATRDYIPNGNYTGEATTFEVDVSDSNQETTQNSNPFGSAPTFADGKYTFNAENQGLAFKLDPELTAKIKEAGSLIVIVNATSDPNTAVFRGCLGNIRRTGGWNHTDMYLNGAALSSISGKPIAININTRNDPDFEDGGGEGNNKALTHFILQKRSDSTTTDVTFTSIKIKLLK